MKFVMPSMKFMPAKVMISLGLVTKTIFVRKNGYHPIAGKQVTEEELNVYEKANIDLLVKIEQIVKAADAENEN